MNILKYAIGRLRRYASNPATAREGDLIYNTTTHKAQLATATDTFVDVATGIAGITNGAGNNVIPKSDGTNLVASQLSDDGTNVSAAVGSKYIFTGRSSVSSPADGRVNFANNAGDHIVGIRISNDLLEAVNSTAGAYVNVRGQAFDVSGQGTISSTANGRFLLTNTGGTDFDLLQFGGITTSFPSLKRSGATILVRLADDSGDAQIISKGTATNDDAAAARIGELLTATRASASATSLTTATPKTITSVSLTAGDWDVWGVVDYIPAATTTTAYIQQGISQTDNTLGTQDTFTACSGGNLSGTVLGSLIAENTPHQRISLASTTTVYLIGNASFAISTLTAYGSIFARRRR